jgi:hypothetical protein
MPSPRPPMTGSVKVVSGNHGANKNVNEMLRKGFNKEADVIAMRRKSGELAKTRASQVDVGTPKKVVAIRTNSGISGKGGTSVGKVFKPMGGAGLGGLFGIKNK